MSLVIKNLVAGVHGRRILHGLSMTVRAGEVHALMGPNGSGKSTLSHALLGRPGYVIESGTATLDGTDLLALPTWQRARAGLFLGMQYPTEVPGVGLVDVLREALGSPEADIAAAMRIEAERIGFDERFLDRALNVDLSGGEKKRNETVQLGVIRPKYAILDELDSGLDVDALRAVSRRVKEATQEFGLGVLAITHYNRLLTELTADVAHVFVKGRIVASGGPELAAELEKTGYEPYAAAAGDDDSQAGGLDDLFGSP